MIGRNLGTVTLESTDTATGWQDIRNDDLPYARHVTVGSTASSFTGTIRLEASPDGSTGASVLLTASSGGNVDLVAGSAVTAFDVPFGEVRIATTGGTEASDRTFHLWIH